MDSKERMGAFLLARFRRDPSLETGQELIAHIFSGLPHFAKAETEYFRTLVADGMNPTEAFAKVDEEFAESTTIYLAKSRLIAREFEGDLEL